MVSDRGKKLSVTVFRIIISSVIALFIFKTFRENFYNSSHAISETYIRTWIFVRRQCTKSCPVACFMVFRIFAVDKLNWRYTLSFKCTVSLAICFRHCVICTGMVYKLNLLLGSIHSVYLCSLSLYLAVSFRRIRSIFLSYRIKVYRIFVIYYLWQSSVSLCIITLFQADSVRYITLHIYIFRCFYTLFDRRTLSPSCVGAVFKPFFWKCYILRTCDYDICIYRPVFLYVWVHFIQSSSVLKHIICHIIVFKYRTLGIVWVISVLNSPVSFFQTKISPLFIKISKRHVTAFYFADNLKFFLCRTLVAASSVMQSFYHNCASGYNSYTYNCDKTFHPYRHFSRITLCTLYFASFCIRGIKLFVKLLCSLCPVILIHI